MNSNNTLYSALDASKPVYSGRELLVVPNYLAATGCAELVAYADRVGGEPAPVGDIQDDGKAENRQDTRFTADRINIGEDPRIAERSMAMCRDIYTNGVAAHYGVEIEWYEMPHILRYPPGGHYMAHSDCENWNPDKNCWERGADRDFSSVLYLNSEFTGGALAFPNLNLQLHPQAGLLVVFPSDHRFVHAAKETISGTRYAFVTWAARVGSRRVMQGYPPGMVRL